MAVHKHKNLSRRSFLVSASAIAVPLSLRAPAYSAPAKPAFPSLPSGIDHAAMDMTVRPQDDFYRYAVGGWIDHVKPPAYMPAWSANRELQLSVYEALNQDISDLSQTQPANAHQACLSDLYSAYMDVARIDALGLAPLQTYLVAIDATRSPIDLLRQIALLSAHGLDVGIGIWIHADDQNPTRYIADFVQSDLGLPNREAYVSDDPHSKEVRNAYERHIGTLLGLSGDSDAPALAAAILRLEIRLAQAQWTEVAKRVPGATSHRMTREQLSTFASGLDVTAFADGVGIPATIDIFNVGQPDYFVAYGQALLEIPVAIWQAYLRYRLLDHLARFLPAPYRTEADNFWTLTIAGASGVRPRWLRAIGMIEETMGDAMGQIYVEKHFAPEARARASALLDNVIAAFRHRIETSSWMSNATKSAAQIKLDQLVIRMGAPDRIRDYSALRTAPDDAVGNWLRARALLANQEIDKLGRIVDREEWTMSPQSVNGYYSVSRNQVVLPAALLQPPYFQASADDAVNYGGLGFFIAHELTHALDRAGSQYDGAGKRVEWMDLKDRSEFERRAKALITQYNAYEIAPGHPLNGELTVGENIADNSGLAIALDAFHLSLNEKPAPRLDGLTGLQRFYIGFARTWASEPVRTPADIAAASTDTHAPDILRVRGALSNQIAFYEAFDVRPDDQMYLSPRARVQIW